MNHTVQLHLVIMFLLSACLLSAQEDLAFNEMVINELVASNDSIGGQMDPDGGFPDWIEFYNTTNRTLDLTGIFLSDDFDDLQKWEFPEGTALAADDYLIVWADNDLDEMGIHAAFRLNRDGEGLYLTNGDGSIIDSVYFSEQQTNVAWARVPNGTGDFQFWTTTILANNEEGTSSTADINNGRLRIFPNPTNGILRVTSEGERIKAVSVIAPSGKRLQNNTGGLAEIEIDLSLSPPGLYILQVEMEGGDSLVERIIKID